MNMDKVLEALGRTSKRDQRVIANRLKCASCGQPLGQAGDRPAVKAGGKLVHERCRKR